MHDWNRYTCRGVSEGTERVDKRVGGGGMHFRRVWDRGQDIDTWRILSDAAFAVRVRTERVEQVEAAATLVEVEEEDAGEEEPHR